MAPAEPSKPHSKPPRRLHRTEKCSAISVPAFACPADRNEPGYKRYGLELLLEHEVNGTG